MLIGTELAIEMAFFYYTIDWTFEISARNINLCCGGLYEKTKEQKKGSRK